MNLYNLLWLRVNPLRSGTCISLKCVMDIYQPILQQVVEVCCKLDKFATGYQAVAK